MSQKKILLNVEEVPTVERTVVNPKTDKETTEIRSIISYSIGNLSVEFKERDQIETDLREFADHLIDKFELIEVVEKKPDENYPDDFPARKVFIKNNIAFAVAVEMKRDELLEVNGIGTETADAVLDYVENEINGEGDDQ